MGWFLTRAPLSDSVAVGDFNGDGRPDVAQTNVIAGSVSVFLGDGRAGFAPPRLHPVGQQPVFVVSGDLDRDGKLDLAVANLGSNDLAILRGDGQGGFLPRSFVPVPVPVPVPRNVAIGDFNGDGIPDLAVASSAPAAVTQPTPGGVAILSGNPGGTYAATQFIATTAGDRPVNANYVAVVDVNSDGRDDLAVGVGIQASTVSVLAGNGDGTLQPAVEFWAGDAPTGVAVGDFDADGRPDVVSGRLRDDHLVLLVNDTPRRGDGVVIEREIPYVSLSRRGFPGASEVR